MKTSTAPVQLDAFPDTIVAVSTESDERYTLFETVKVCSKLANVKGWDLDVAACAAAHVAARYLTKTDNGLLLPWWGRVWCNPPWSDIGPWVKKAWSEWGREQLPPVCIGMLLPATRTDMWWWQEFVEPHRDRPDSPLHVRFLPDRIQYGQPNDLLAEHAGTPNFGSVFLWWKRAAQVTKRRKGKGRKA